MLVTADLDLTLRGFKVIVFCDTALRDVCTRQVGIDVERVWHVL